MGVYAENDDFKQSVNTVESWHYEDKGKRIGPILGTDMASLIDSGTINRETMVWREGLSDWKSAVETELENQFKSPPPVLAQNVNNKYVWILAFAPAIGAFLEGFISGLTQIDIRNLWWITIVLNIGLCVIDDKVLEKAGYDTSKFKGWLWFVPVYLFQRAKVLKQSKAYFVVWLVTFLLIVLQIL